MSNLKKRVERYGGRGETVVKKISHRDMTKEYIDRLTEIYNRFDYLKREIERLETFSEADARHRILLYNAVAILQELLRNRPFDFSYIGEKCNRILEQSVFWTYG